MHEPVKAIFTECIQTQIAAADLLQEPVMNAAGLLVDSLLSGRTVFCCGERMAHASARHFAHIMLTGLHFDRPPFPVQALHADFGSKEHEYTFAQQILAAGQAGDVLVVLNAGTTAPRVSKAMEAALSRGMLIIALTSDADVDVAGLLGPEDVEIRIPSRNSARVSEHLLQLVNMLCSLAEQQIFPQESE